MSLLASDTIGPVVAALFLSPIILAGLCLILFLAKRSRGDYNVESGNGPDRLGLVLGVAPIVFGAFLILMLLTTRGGAPQFFYAAAIVPIIVGIRILRIRRRSNRR